MGKKPPVIVATPGRLWELLESEDYLKECLPSLKTLVFDEADRMIEGGHFKELTSILEYIYFNRH